MRLLRPADAQAFYDLTNDPVIADIISFLIYPVPRAFADEWIAKNEGAQERVYGAYRDGVMVGYIGLHDEGSQGIEIGYWVGTAYAGQGIASGMVALLTGAIEHTNPDARIFAECLPDNVGSWRVLEKNGFISTGDAGHRAGRIRLERPIRQRPGRP